MLVVGVFVGCVYSGRQLQLRRLAGWTRSTDLRLMIAAGCSFDWIALGHTFCTDSLLVKCVLARLNCISWFLHPQGPLIDTKGVALRFLIPF